LPPVKNLSCLFLASWQRAVPHRVGLRGQAATAKKTCLTEGNKGNEGKKTHPLPLFVTFVAFCKKTFFVFGFSILSRHAPLPCLAC
jgi:hypothetical protein